MDGLLHKHARLIGSFLYLLVGVAALDYALWYRPYRSGAAELAGAISELRRENAELGESRPAPSRVTPGTTTPPPDAGALLPAFLARINEIASRNAIIIRRMRPEGNNSARFTLEFDTHYPACVRFIAELEAMGVPIDGLQIHLKNGAEGFQPLQVTLSLLVRESALQVDPEQVAQVRRRVEEQGLRDPFQGGEALVEGGRADLSERYKLSGIGRAPDGRPYATINRTNYFIGEGVDDLTLMEIHKEHVVVERPGSEGREQYLIQFRKARREQRP